MSALERRVQQNVKEGHYMVSEETLTEITKRLINGFHPDKIILFGSQARGTADKHSDVDISEMH